VTGKILVVGDVMTDVIVRPAGPLVPGSDRAATIRLSPGGSGANQAAWLGHLGAQVGLIARVGAADAVTQADTLRAHGVTPHLAVDQSLPTGMLVALLDSTGERSFLTDRAANAALGDADLPAALLGDASLLHISGYSLFSEGPRAAVLAFAAAARRKHIPVTLDAASAGFLAEVGPSRFLDWTAGIETLFANQDEAAALTGATDPAEQFATLSRHFPIVVLKRGAEGALALARGSDPVAASTPTVAAIDTTGAGDAFLAGFLHRRLAGGTLAESLAAGAALGARAATQLGGRPILRSVPNGG
jgi:sugar/nucleoside kinase (ribokinase family)